LKAETNVGTGYFYEGSPDVVFNQLFGHLVEGDKVGITTRIHDNASEKYATAYREKGINARIVSNQTGIEDYCFLTRAQRETIGGVISTFGRWAMILSPAKSTTFYVSDKMVNNFMFNNLYGRLTKRWNVDPGYSMKVYPYILHIQNCNLGSGSSMCRKTKDVQSYRREGIVSINLFKFST
jgi:hypothetical protein